MRTGWRTTGKSEQQVQEAASLASTTRKYTECSRLPRAVGLMSAGLVMPVELSIFTTFSRSPCCPGPSPEKDFLNTALVNVFLNPSELV